VAKHKPLSLRRIHSLDLIKFVIFLRFNSLTTDQGGIARSCNEIFKITGVKPSSQSNMFKRWKDCGFSIYNRLVGHQKNRIANDEQEKWMCDEKILQEMAHLSLFARAEKIRVKFGFEKFSLDTLRSIYRKNGVRLVKPQYHYSRKLSQHQQLQDAQYIVCKEITEAMIANKHIIYVDESSFH